MILYPNAKINLGLNVVARRADGYHDLETVFFPLRELCDKLEINARPELDAPSLSLDGVPLKGEPEDNLVMKAWRLLKRDFPSLPPVEIRLHKRIPSQAGMGGGSSDASFMLLGLNKLGELGLTISELEKYAARLGADCPFFIHNRTLYAEGTGNEFSPVDCSLDRGYVVVVKPPVFISTAEAFRHVVPRESAGNLRALLRLPVKEWKGKVRNDFEESVFPSHPELAEIKEKLYQLGAVYAAMSGSGSALFGIFSTEVDEQKIQECFPSADCFVLNV